MTKRKGTIRLGLSLAMVVAFGALPLAAASFGTLPEAPVPVPDPLPEPVDEVVEAIEEALNPSQPPEEQPGPTDEDQTQDETTSDSNTESGSQTSGSFTLPSETADQVDPLGPAQPAKVAQAVAGSWSIEGTVGGSLLASVQPAPVATDSGYRPTYVSRSTARVMQLLWSVNAAPAMIARVLAPFPVAGEATYSDDWGAPRSHPFFHLHQGVDIFAERGTPVIASTSGTITEMTFLSPVAGNSVKLSGPDGTYYIYAHLDRFIPLFTLGTVVAKGQVIGFVGTSGNAEGGRPHLHFEIHPKGGPAVPPVPYLDRWIEEALVAARSLKESPSNRFASSLTAFPGRLKDAVSNFSVTPQGARVAGSGVASTALPVASILFLAWYLRRRRTRALVPAEGWTVNLS